MFDHPFNLQGFYSIFTAKCKNSTLSISICISKTKQHLEVWTPSRKIYSKDVANKVIEKRQAELLLQNADENFLENHIKTATRGKNILDLCFTNNHTLINDYKRPLNRDFSDHNLIQTDLRFSFNVQKLKKLRRIHIIRRCMSLT